MKLAIAGCGVVGSAIAEGFERLGHKVYRHDPARFNTTIEDVIEFGPDITFICVPTPQDADGSCNTSIVESVVDELVDKGFDGIIAIKSTVEPGTTERLYVTSEVINPNVKLAFVPEFLRERSAFYDFTEGHDTCVVGVPPTPYGDMIYDEICRAHGRYPKNFVRLTWAEAELVKYFSNVFNALRVTFANGFYDICQSLGADYTKIKNAVATRKTFTDMYLDVNENLRGFSGVCLPKDSAALASLVKRIGLESKIFQTIVEDNRLYEPRVMDGMRGE